MLVIGLTGGMGSGKSTVAQLFAERGVPVIDADTLAKTLTEPNQPAFNQIIAHFPKYSILKNGRLDRAKLRDIIFSDPIEKKWLEQLLHPLIKAALQNNLQTIQAPYCLLVIPLLIETGPYPFIDRILVIDTPPNLQIKRAAKRDRTNFKAIEGILKSQAKQTLRLKQADDVIKNDGKIEDLVPEVETLHLSYLKLAQK